MFDNEILFKIEYTFKHKDDPKRVKYVKRTI